MLNRWSLLLFMLCLVCCNACSGRQAGSHPAPALQGGLAQLPLPAPHALPREAAEVKLHRYERGVNYSLTLNSGDNLEPKDLNVVMKPAYSGSGLAGLAYAAYALPLYNYQGAGSVGLYWPQPPATHTDVFLGLANYTLDRWDWFSVDENYLCTPPVLADYIGPDNFMRVAVVLAGDTEAALGVVRIGGDNPPIAKITSDKSFGPSPLAVQFIANGSHDEDGEIVSYEWDPEGDGTFTAPDLNVLHDVLYLSAGVYPARCRVLDNEGNVTEVTHNIVVSDVQYDEVEHNDSVLEANVLPSGSFGGYTGNLGPDGPQDGDAEDYFVFSVSQPAVVNLTLDYSFADADLSCQLQVLENGIPVTGHLEQTYYNTPNDDETGQLSLYPGQYLLRIYNSSVINEMLDKTADYTLSMAYEYTTPPTAILSATPALGAAMFDVQLDASQSSDDSAIVEYQWDLYGDGIYELVTDQFTNSTNYTITRVGRFQPRLRIKDTDGFVVRTTAEFTSTGALDEVEDNNDIDKANELPQFPFGGFMADVGGDADEYDLRDCYWFEVADPNTELLIQAVYEPTYGTVEASLLDGDLNVLDSSNTASGAEALQVLVGPGTYYVVMQDGIGATDYQISGQILP